MKPTFESFEYCWNPLTIEEVEYSIKLNEAKMDFYSKTNQFSTKKYDEILQRLKLKLENLKNEPSQTAAQDFAENDGLAF